uniref:Uncharacterized protein n=1 Tax=uncultured organism MedDCM-OCT-S08-C1350 TaxID=743627 RepID=D6PKI3_9ZZZZ|nr:hypothetical protein [uncultured organism MedDCM-OCT-S08-C1350]
MAIITLNNNSLSSVTALPAGVGGKVLQVVSHENTYEQTSTSATLVDILISSGTTWEPAITPTVSTSTILILASIHIAPRDNSDTQQEKDLIYIVMQKLEVVVIQIL